MSKHTRMLMATLVLMSATTLQAATPLDDLLAQYQQQSNENFNATAGKELWNQTFTPNGASEPRSCVNCHTADVRQPGRHAITGKDIKPLAPSVMSKRLTNPDKIRKWLKRNCEWTLGRECTAQEKGDVLSYLKTQ